MSAPVQYPGLVPAVDLDGDAIYLDSHGEVRVFNPLVEEECVPSGWRRLYVPSVESSTGGAAPVDGDAVSASASAAGPDTRAGTGPAAPLAYTASRELPLALLEPGDEIHVMDGVSLLRSWVRVTGRVECEGDPDDHDEEDGPFSRVRLGDCAGVVLLDDGSEWHHDTSMTARVRIPCEVDSDG